MSCGALTPTGWRYLGWNDVVHDAGLYGILVTFFLNCVATLRTATGRTSHARGSARLVPQHRYGFIYGSSARGLCLCAICAGVFVVCFLVLVFSCHAISPPAKLRSIWLEAAALTCVQFGLIHITGLRERERRAAEAAGSRLV